jgi:beta-glucosidase
VGTEHYFDDYPQAFAAALAVGMDSFTDHDNDADFVTGHISTALERQLISMADVDRSVRRKLLIRLRLGEFDPDGGPFAKAGVMDSAEHRELALRAARRSAVLLRNDAGLLPLAPEETESVAVVGPLAATLYEDWYSPALLYSATISDGLAEVFGKVITHECADRVRTSLGVFDVFDWGGDIVTLRSADTGKYLAATDTGLAATADKPDGWVVRETFKLTPLPGGAALLESTATRQSFRLAWEPLTDGIAAAVDAARTADAAIVVVGNDPMIGGREAHDRHDLELPAGMARLVREVTAANPRTVLLLMSSYPYTTPDETPAVVWTSHAGQETGRAIASLLSGEHAFEGRLPQAWPAADADLPDPLDYDIIQAGWTYQYTPARPKYPFGHGLTYTTFGYGPLSLSLTDGEVTAALDLTNTGDRAGTEVVQLYASYPRADQPRRRLIGFTRVALDPGQSAAVTLTVPATRLELWDVAAQHMTLPPGPLQIHAAASSEDTRQTATLRLPPAAPVRRTARIPAADYDEQENITLTDTSRSAGTSITPAHPARTAWARYDNLNTSRLGEPAFLVACASPAGGRIEVWLTEPSAGGSPAVSVEVPSTGGRFSWNCVTAQASIPDSAVTVYLALHGPVRLDWFQL